MMYIRIKKGYLDISTSDTHFRYDIDFGRFKTIEDLKDWIKHLRVKNWWTPTREEELIESFKKING